MAVSPHGRQDLRNKLPWCQKWQCLHYYYFPYFPFFKTKVFPRGHLFQTPHTLFGPFRDQKSLQFRPQPTFLGVTPFPLCTEAPFTPREFVPFLFPWSPAVSLFSFSSAQPFSLNTCGNNWILAVIIENEAYFLLTGSGSQNRQNHWKVIVSVWCSLSGKLVPLPDRRVALLRLVLLEYSLSHIVPVHMQCFLIS